MVERLYLYHKVYIDLLFHHLPISAKEHRFGSAPGPNPDPRPLISRVKKPRHRTDPSAGSTRHACHPALLAAPSPVPRPYRSTTRQSSAVRRWLKSRELSGVSRELVVSKESQHADSVSAATSPAACPIRARWFSTNILQDWTGDREGRVCISQLGQRRHRGGEKHGRLGVWVESRRPLPSQRDAHGQQRSLGVAALYVVHGCLQILSVAGTEGPVGLRQTRSLGKEGSPARGSEMEGRWGERLSRAPGPGIFLRAVLRKRGTHQQLFPMAAPVIEHNSPVAHRHLLARLSLRAPPLCQPSERPRPKVPST